MNMQANVLKKAGWKKVGEEPFLRAEFPSTYPNSTWIHPALEGVFSIDEAFKHSLTTNFLIEAEKKFSAANN